MICAGVRADFKVFVEWKFILFSVAFLFEYEHAFFGERIFHNMIVLFGYSE